MRLRSANPIFARVARELDIIAVPRFYSTSIVSDNGMELTSTAILRWWQDRRMA
jgi:hypothetical protein